MQLENQSIFIILNFLQVLSSEPTFATSNPLSNVSSKSSILLIPPCTGGSHEIHFDKIAEHFISTGYKAVKLRLRRTDEVIKEEDIHIAQSTGLDITCSNMVNSSCTFQTINLRINTTHCKSRHVTDDGRFHMDFAFLWTTSRYVWNVPMDAFEFGDCLCRMFLENKALLSFLKEQEFRISIIDMAGNDCGLALAHILDIPVVAHNGGVVNVGQGNVALGFLSPAVNVNMMTEISDLRNFGSRLWNFAVTAVDHICTPKYPAIILAATATNDIS